MVLNYNCAGVKSDGWADVTRDTIKTISNVKLVRNGSFDDEMFFTVRDCIVIRQIQKLDAWVRHF